MPANDRRAADDFSRALREATDSLSKLKSEATTAAAAQSKQAASLGKSLGGIAKLGAALAAAAPVGAAVGGGLSNVAAGGSFRSGAAAGLLGLGASLPLGLGDLLGFGPEQRIRQGTQGRLDAFTGQAAQFGLSVSDDQRRQLRDFFQEQAGRVERDQQANKALVNSDAEQAIERLMGKAAAAIGLSVKAAVIEGLSAMGFGGRQ